MHQLPKYIAYGGASLSETKIPSALKKYIYFSLLEF
jgi:hypothetical protein